MKSTYLMLGLALASPWATAEDRQVYHYGMDLDVAQAISTTEPSGCMPGEATMTYKDSKGEVHTLVYVRQGSDCRD
ncbi:DUF2790 domain-containing protein [Pseudomonas indica]|uniref:DUF2790 domain-containing protein n=1 Tax=Pseudomonas indica TaxID=137658 RepID=UPI000BABF8DB|nr:DUF2790 domain-containing protein [Pseudomonas indica]PAU58942.1 hypothetical protein BZL42_12110 [Pseudomonas indica]